MLDLVADGEEIVITREGKQVARLIRAQHGVGQRAAIRAAAEIREMRKGVRLGRTEIEDLIGEGRKRIADL